MASLDIRFIGSGNAFAAGGLCWNGFVVDGRTLFEAPPSALMMLNRARIDPNDIDTVLLSHHHGDHFLGLPSLLLHWKYTERTRPVTIAGPPGTEDLAKQIGSAVYPGLFDSKMDIEWVTMRPGACLQRENLEVEAIEVEHDDRLGLSLGFACRFNGRRLGYTGDSRLCDGVRDLARTSEVLVSECASREARIPIHMNLVDDMPEVRAAMRDEAHLILTHLPPDVDDNGLKNTIVARELETYRF